MTNRIRILATSTAIAALMLVLTAGYGLLARARSTDDLTGYTSDVSEVQVITAVVGGKNVYIPSTIVVTAGKPQTLSIFNTADKPHGFRIKGLSIEVVLKPGEETPVELPNLKGGEIYTIDCQLHPPHRHGTLVVVPGR